MVQGAASRDAPLPGGRSRDTAPTRSAAQARTTQPPGVAAPAPAGGAAASLLRLQSVAGNRAASLAVQRLTFHTTRYVVSSGPKKPEELTKQEVLLGKRETWALERWKALERLVGKLEQQHAQEVADVKDRLARLARHEVKDWDATTSATAGQLLDDVEQSLATLEKGAKKVERAEGWASVRTKRQKKVDAAKTRLGPLLLHLSAEEQGLDLISPIAASLTRHRGQLATLATARDDATYCSLARGFLESVEVTERMFDLGKASAQLAAHRERVHQTLKALRAEVTAADQDLERVDGAEDDAMDLWHEMDEADGVLGADSAMKGSTLQTDCRAVRDAASDAYRSARKALAVHHPEVEALQQAVGGLSLATPLSTLTPALAQARDVRTRCADAARRCRAAAEKASARAEPVRISYRAYQHKNAPPATTAKKTHGLAGASAVPVTITSGGASFERLAHGTTQYGRLHGGALSAYPGAAPLFAEALTRGLIPSRGTGETGVKRRAGTTYELKVRRTVLTANGLPATLRVQNTNAPVTTPEGRLAITFDAAVMGH